MTSPRTHTWGTSESRLLLGANDDRRSARGSAEAVVQARSTAIELVAASATVRLIAERDVVARPEALRPRHVQAGGADVECLAGPAAHFARPGAARDDIRGEGVARGQSVDGRGSRRVGDCSVRGCEPVQELCAIGFGLGLPKHDGE